MRVLLFTFPLNDLLNVPAVRCQAGAGHFSPWLTTVSSPSYHTQSRLRCNPCGLGRVALVASCSALVRATILTGCRALGSTFVAFPCRLPLDWSPDDLMDSGDVRQLSKPKSNLALRHTSSTSILAAMESEICL